MKRLFALLTAVVLALTCVACSDGDTQPTTTAAVITTTTATEATTTTAATTATETATTTTEAITTTTAAKSTAKTTVKTTPTTKKVSSIERMLNEAPLHPEKTNAPALDAMIDEIFAKIHTANMTTYDKVKACFDYLVNNFTYGSDPFGFIAAYGVLEDRLYESDYDAHLIINSYSILSSSVGVCDDYSAAFAVMCRRIGLEAFVRGGVITNTQGVPSGHAWATITLEGVPYIFDPQVQARSSGSYNFFGRSYTYNSKTTYQLYDDIYDPADYRHFAYTLYVPETTPPTTTLPETSTTLSATATTAAESFE